MSKTREQVNNFYHGPVDIGSGITADYVVAHAARQLQRGRGPSVSYDGERNPRKALQNAKAALEARTLWDDNHEIGSGAVGILVLNGPSEPIDRDKKWPTPNGLVGLRIEHSDVPHVRLRGYQYIPSPDGTVAISTPAPIEQAAGAPSPQQ